LSVKKDASARRGFFCLKVEKKFKIQSKNAILFEMNLTAEKQKNAENFGLVRVKIMRVSCYESPSLMVELKFEAGDQVFAEFSKGLKRKNVLLERPTAESFLSEIGGRFGTSESNGLLKELSNLHL
jgi:hypothetical protein